FPHCSSSLPPSRWDLCCSQFQPGQHSARRPILFSVRAGPGRAGRCTAATNVVNAFADRREDVVNQPSRVFWVEQVGPHGTIISIIALYALAFTASLFLGPLFMLVLAVGVFNSIFYSARPLRFKARPFLSLISFSGAAGLAFLSGLSILGSINLLNPVFLLITYFMLTYGTVKN